MSLVKQLKIFVNVNRQNIYSFLRKINMRLRQDPTTIDHLKPTINCRKKWYGSSYGGFFVNPNLITKESVVYSFGIGKDISFDRKIMANHHCKVYGFDPTPKSIDYIASLPKQDLFLFYEFGISKETGLVKFFLPKNKRAVSASLNLSEFVDEQNYIDVEMKSLEDITKELGHTHIDVLKMDIEGTEYEVLESLVNANITIDQLLIEFHDRFYPGEIKSKRMTEFLNKNGFEIFAASLNYEEISFINTKI